MDIQKYLTKLNIESQDIFTKTISEKERIGMMHHLSSCIYELSNFVADPKERGILETVSAQLESATFNLTLGLYRQAFTSLRLAFEMGLAAIYFSANKIELHEWLQGCNDIKWSKLVNEENGVLSRRFTDAFFSELSDYVEHYRISSISVYRKLSEYVHGNNETWTNSGIKLCYNKDLFEQYVKYYKSITEIILFISVCRYSELLDDSAKESLQFIPEEFNHIPAIRTFFGRT